MRKEGMVLTKGIWLLRGKIKADFCQYIREFERNIERD